MLMMLLLVLVEQLVVQLVLQSDNRLCLMLLLNIASTTRS